MLTHSNNPLHKTRMKHPFRWHQKDYSHIKKSKDTMCYFILNIWIFYLSKENLWHRYGFSITLV